MTRFRCRQAAAALGAVAAIAAFVVSAAAPAAAEQVQISEGKLLWSVKESWRKYIGTGSQVGDGAEITGWALDANGDPSYAEGFSFPVVSGSFDEETDTTVLRLGGYVHFQSWYGLTEPGKYALDTKYSDLELEISREAQVLRGTHTGYARTDPGGELHVDEDVVLARFDIAGATTSFEAGQSRWTEIPTVAGPGLSVYGESTVLDDTSFEYSGPGGIPDLAERWDTPGAPGLDPGGAWLADAKSGARSLYPSETDDVVHTVDLVGQRTTGAKLVVEARDAETMEAVGTPYVWTFPGAVSSDRQELRTTFDPETDSIFFVTYQDGAERREATVRRAVWDPGAQSYAVEVVGSLGSALTSSRRVTALAWNSVEDELAAIAYAGSTGDIYATDTLHRFHLEEGAWEHEEALLRLPDSGEWAEASSVTSPFGVASTQVPDEKALAVARDGSYVSASRTGRTSSSGVAHYYPALHIAVAADGSTTVSPIEGTTTPRTALGTYYGFASLSTAADGSLLLHNSSQVMDAYARIDVVEGEAVKVGEIVDAPTDIYSPYELSGFANSMAADGARGIVWATDPYDPDGYRLDALRGDEIVGRYSYAEFPEASANGAFGRLAVGADGSVYLPIKDAESSRLGYRRLAYTGIVPEVTAQPEDRSVILGPGQASKAVQFSVAIADGGDAIQWQSRSAGAAAFSDLDGATGATLEVDAKPASDGTVYRAKVSNAAGKVVSDEATLDVEYAPLIVSDLASREVTEGTDAVFVVSADGDPEPEVSWQRRVDGYWQPIASDDDNFVVNGPSLTVLDTNVEQSGSLFRAKLTNSAGTVYSQQARLTVTARTAIPEEGIDLDQVSLDWTGNPEMQKAPPYGGSNYFSAGISEGDEATYSAASGNARVLQVSAAGEETPASWATRAEHVSNGGEQLVRLYGGTGRIEADGSASVEWDGAFSVNFYGGLVPFTLTDPELVVDEDGTGTLTADLSGCESSQANPEECVPFAPHAGATVSTFSGVEVDPSGEVTITPDYAGVEVEVPEGTTPQDRTVSGWGAWPQSFVDFHVETGLSSYWYSSGGSFDPYKPPHPFVVDFEGESLPAEPAPAPGGEGSEAAPQSQSGAQTETPGGGSAAIAAVKGVQRVDGKRRVTVASLSCPSSGSCTVKVPKRVRIRIAGRAYAAKVTAPQAIEAGGSARVEARLSKAAVTALGDGSVKLKVRIVLRSAEQVVRRTATVKARGPVKTLSVGDDGRVALGELRCAGAARCAVRAPRRIAAKVAGKAVRAKLIAPRSIGKGEAAKVEVKLGSGALKRLAGNAAIFRTRAMLRSADWRSVQVLEARLKRGEGGDGGDGEPRSGTISAEPGLLARPASAVDVTDVHVTWYPRDSWVRYASSGVATGDGIHFSNGATGTNSGSSPCPDRSSSSDAQLPYTIGFAAKASWYDPASGVAGIYGQGSVRFKWKAHQIDLTASDPEIEINGAASRAIFRFSGSEGTAYAEQRADLISLDLSGQPTVGNGGKTLTYSLMRGTLTENGVNVFAGFYTPPDNDEFGCVSVAFTVP